jgi:CheY-like chemotaxis protein
LLVEDNEDNLRIYSTILGHFGFRVVAATDGESGLARANEERPDVIVMDLSIPRIDGWEATRRLKANAATAAIPVVALTAHALDTDVEVARSVGFDAYITKPVRPTAVVAEVRRLLGQSKNP